MNVSVINTATLRNNLADTISEISKKKDYLLVAKRGKITSALVDIDLFEDLLALSNKKYVESIKKARKEYEQRDVFSHIQAFGEV
ncbi:hypothetical protein A2773_04155 [Candidatus Gottesmanbacteria bacterium RIFCSPHIGHO2_01_FULL_39_10]|uniref:Antitoxin n=1 Tax=Candidatus Gottesmanbacteria bacterium RIFCSPHIGHO2_01_FULL_39_10 TaxID=1798375 RepID=A0A1F5ZSH5_9BACT|nr:MAG: hypothetical protein A2773_04155 [Candidatus Gottesmanbacteria bacterium RIFCSPHIGHO2_01_FULL_39_10]